MFTRDATRQPRILALVISYSIPTIINLVKEHRSRVNNARAARRRAIIPAILTLLNNHLRFLSRENEPITFLRVIFSFPIIFFRNLDCVLKITEIGENAKNLSIFRRDSPHLFPLFLKCNKILNTCKYKIFVLFYSLRRKSVSIYLILTDSFEITILQFLTS